jgi:hypothetical protein
VPLPRFRHWPAPAIDLPHGEPVQTQALPDDFRNRHLPDGTAEAFVQAEAEVKLIA